MDPLEAVEELWLALAGREAVSATEGAAVLRQLARAEHRGPESPGTGPRGYGLSPGELVVDLGMGPYGVPVTANLLQLSRQLPTYLMACLVARAPAPATGGGTWSELLRANRRPVICEAVESGGYVRHVLRGLLLLRSILNMLALEAKRRGDLHSAEIGPRGGAQLAAEETRDEEATAKQSRAVLDLSILGMLHGLEGMRRNPHVGGGGVGAGVGAGTGTGSGGCHASYCNLVQESLLVLRDVHGPFSGYDCASELWHDIFRSSVAPRVLATAVQGVYWAGTREAVRAVASSFRQPPGSVDASGSALRALEQAEGMLKFLTDIMASPVSYLGLLEYEYQAQHSPQPQGGMDPAQSEAHGLTLGLLRIIKDAIELRCRTAMPGTGAPAGAEGWNMSVARAAQYSSEARADAAAGGAGAAPGGASRLEGLSGGAFPTASCSRLRERLTSLANAAVLLILCLTDSDKREFCGEQAEFLDQAQLRHETKIEMAAIAKYTCHLFEKYMAHLRYRPSDATEVGSRESGANLTTETLLGSNLLRLMEILVADSNYAYCSRYIARCVAVHLIQPPASFQWMWLFQASPREDIFKKFLGFELMRPLKIDGADRSICMPQTEAWEILRAYLRALKFHHSHFNCCSGALERMLLFFKLVGILYEVKFPEEAGTDAGRPVLVVALQQVVQQVLRAWGGQIPNMQASGDPPTRAGLISHAEQNALALKSHVGEGAPMALYSLLEYDLLSRFHAEVEQLQTAAGPSKKRMRLLPGNARNFDQPASQPAPDVSGDALPEGERGGRDGSLRTQPGNLQPEAGARPVARPVPPVEYEGGSRMRAYAA